MLHEAVGSMPATPEEEKSLPKYNDGVIAEADPNGEEPVVEPINE